jgi:hypothetical protein
VLDRLLEKAESVPGGLRDVYAGLNAALREWSVQLTPPVASLIKDLVVKGFTQHGSAWDMAAGTWLLFFTVADDPLVYSVQFQIS